MTTLTQIEKDFEKIAKKAKENYILFQQAAPKKNTKDQVHVEKINFLKKLQNFPISSNLEGFYTSLKNLVDPNNEDPNKDIEALIDSLPEETTAQLDAKVQARVSLKKIKQGINLFNTDLETAIRVLDSKMERMTPDQYKTYQDTVKYNTLITEINEEQLLPAPKHMTPELNKAYKEMKVSFDKAKKIGSGYRSLEVEINFQQYKNNKKNYQQTLTAENNVDTAADASKKLLERYKEIVDKLPKGAAIMELPKKKPIPIDNISYIDRMQLTSANIMRYNAKVEAIIEIMETKYSTDLTSKPEAAPKFNNPFAALNQFATASKNFISEKLTGELNQKSTQTSKSPEVAHPVAITSEEVRQNAQSIANDLSAMKKELELSENYISEKLRKELNEQYMKIKNSTLLDQNTKEIAALKNNISKIPSNIVEQYNLSKTKTEQEITNLKKVINKEHYEEYHSSLQSFSISEPTQTNLPADLIKDFKNLNQIRAKVEDLKTTHEKIENSVEKILAGLKNNEGVDILQTTLSDKNSENLASTILNIAALKSPERRQQIVRDLAQIKLGNLAHLTVKGIDAFIKMDNAKNAHLQDITIIQDKLKCYEIVQAHESKDTYLPLVDNKEFRQTLFLLQSVGIKDKEAIALADTEEKRQMLSTLQENCEGLTADEVKGMLSSTIRTQAADALFTKMELPKAYGEFVELAKEDKQQLYTLLIREIYTNEQYAKAIINIQNNKQLFNSVALLSLAKWGDTLHVHDSTKDFLIEKLNSPESLDYQTVLGQTIQSDYTPHFEKDLHLLKINADKQIAKFFSLKENLIPIKKLAKVFEEVDKLFTPLIEQARQGTDPKLVTKLQVTQRAIFNEFTNNTWDEAIAKSTGIINEKLKDNSSAAQKILSGFDKLIERISNWWKNIENTQKPDPLEAKQINSQFKAAMGQIREENQVEDVSYKAKM